MKTNKKIVFSHHARLRLAQRDIGEETVRQVLKDADYVKKTFDNRKIAVKQTNRRILNVVYIEEENKIIIITVY